jgi:hypothetical protein
MELYDFNVDGGNSTVHTLSNDITVNNQTDLKVSGSGTTTLNGNTLFVLGNVIQTSAFNTAGTTVIEFSGTGSPTWTQAGDINNPIIINKPSGTLTISGSHTLGGNFTYTTAGGVTTTGSTVLFDQNLNIDSDGMAFNNVTIEAGTSTLTSNMNVDGNFSILSGAAFSPGTHTLNLAGDYTNAGTFTAGSSTVIADGGTQLFDGTTTFNNLTNNASTINFEDADIFTVSGACAGNGTWSSDDGTNTVDVDCTTETITTANCTRVDSAGGTTITSSGTLTSCVNWSDGTTTRMSTIAVMFMG